jgi:hypothetical protein
VAACGGDVERAPDDGGGTTTPDPTVSWEETQDADDLLMSIEGLSGPEAVRYDPEQDVWFVSNFGPGAGDERDGDGFISRVDAASGTVTELRFATGIEVQPLHMPRGMYITGDTLWVADVDGVHGFHRRSGAPLGFHDFRGREPGFLNDVALGPDGALYVTDTGRSSVYRIGDGQLEAVLADPLLGQPNGITWHATRGRFVLVPWDPGHPILSWAVGASGTGAASGGSAATGVAGVASITETTPLSGTTNGRLDGVEVVDGRLIVASQTDSTLHVLDGDTLRPLVRVAGEPADIGIDTRRGRVAVPYVGLDRVDVWRLPGR